MPVGAALVRVHRLDRHPVFFSPAAGTGPVGRFDSPSGAFGVLFLAQSLAGAFAETVLRNPQRWLVDLSEVASRVTSTIKFSRPLRLAEMRGAGLQALGTDNAISTGPYGPCGIWADVLHGHPDRPDGIAYASRHSPDQLCVALFTRDDLTLGIEGRASVVKQTTPALSTKHSDGALDLDAALCGSAQLTSDG